MPSVVIPANNEEGYIGACLAALLAQEGPEAALAGTEIVVAANACTDRTVAIARGFEAEAAARGWRLAVLDLERGGKPLALNAGDAAAMRFPRVYLDADVVMGPRLLAALVAALDREAPAYASGRLEVAPASSRVTRAYARVWTRLPFMTDCVAGAGLFAVNAAGRARWGAFPEIISDDMLARLSFAPHERIGVDEPFLWPMVEGFSRLVRVRRRQDAGVAELAALRPGLMANEDKPALTRGRLLRIALSDPLGLAVYVGVALAVRAKRGGGWSRGR